ncbi:MAG TPA: ABC transporter substrate-binding protein [Dermatophilaceae bacterium]|nr:ABC transporter substrate-binding protein [Dermatophilaceae bacterium]
MTTRRTMFTLTALLTAGSLALAGCAESTTPSTGGPSAAATGDIKIGAVLDITGAGASLGVPERQALEMLADQVNAAGGVNGRKIKLFIEDNQSTEDGAAKAVNKLISTEQVDLILGASRTGPSLAMRPIAEQAKTPMISLAANAKIVDGSTWVFKTAQNDKVVLEKLADDMKASGYKKIAIARDASGFGEGIPEMLTDIGKSAGIEVTAVEKFAPDATDFTAQMVKIRDAKPDAVLIWGIPPAAANAQKAYRQLGLTAPVYQSHGIGNQVFLDTAGDSANGLKAALGRMLIADQLADNDPQKPVVTKFIADYKAKYNQSPSTFAGHAHDGFMIAVEALKKAGTDKAKLRDAIEGISNWPGISGVFTMTKEDHSGLSKDALVMVEVKDKTWTAASTS